jgi:hypothetical protein
LSEVPPLSDARALFLAGFLSRNATVLTPSLTPTGVPKRAIWCPLVRASRIQKAVAEGDSPGFDSRRLHHRGAGACCPAGNGALQT